MLELMEVRKGLEVQAAMLAASRREPEDLEALERTVHDMRQNMHDFDAFTRLDVEYHMQIARASHNEMIVHLVESIREALKNTIAAGLRSRSSEEQLENLQQTHEKLYQTLRQRDVEAARITMNQHFDEAMAAINEKE